MGKVYWSKNAFASSGNTSTWGDAREADESASSTLNTTSTGIKGINYFLASGRGSNTYRVERCYFAFDMSAYTGISLTNLEFNFTPTTATSGTFSSNRLIKTDAFGSSTTFTDYSDEDWYESLNFSTVYSSGFTFPDSTTAQTVALNSTAVSAISSTGYLQVCMVTSGDYSNIAPITDINNAGFLNVGSNTAGNVFLTFDDPGYGNNVNGVTASNIVKINDVATADITKLNDIS
tara:strand:+ start:177 stop:878 length:702 start_codon:yes stop_codon:yes gene_type:complete